MRFIGFLAFTLLLPLIACRPMQPSGGRESNAGQLTLTLDPGSFSLLSETPSQLRIRIYKVENDRATDQEGNDHLFPVSSNDASYRVAGVKLGWKELRVALLNDAGEIVGEGTARHLVLPGAQTLAEPLRIQVRPPTRRRRDVGMTGFVRFNSPGQEPKVTWLDVKDLVRDKCANCHNPPADLARNGSLLLHEFPFSSVSFPTQPEIVTDMIRWMSLPSGDPYLMPKGGPRLPDADISLMTRWVGDGTLQNPPGSDQTDALAQKLMFKWKFKGGDEEGGTELPRGTDPARPFGWSCAALIIQGRYDFELSVVATDGRLVHTQTFADVVIGESGEREFVIDVPYAEPQVDVPVVIVP